MTKGLITGFAKWQIVPRALCQYLLIDLPIGLSRNQARAAISLQLNRLDGRPNLEFAFRAPLDGTRQWAVWYWSGEGSLLLTCPEPLIRQTMGKDGLALWSCQAGYELTYTLGGVLLKTRWYPSEPNAQAWQTWLEECGLGNQAQPPVQAVNLLRKPPGPWLFQRHMQKTAWGAGQFRKFALIAMAGLVLGGAGSVSLGIERQNKDLQAQIETLQKQASQAIELQKQINLALKQAQDVAIHAPSHQHLAVLGQLAQSDVLGGKDRPFLVEWNDQNGRLRMLVAWPPGARLDEFLSAIETLGLFQDIKLMPNPPLGAIVIQAQIKS